MSECASGDSRQLPPDCFRLETILHNFNSPISEEQAWALCYTFAVQYLSHSVSYRHKLVFARSLRDVILHKEGYIHPNTFLDEENDRASPKNVSEAKVVSEFGTILYQALDYSCSSQVERILSPPLNRLIDLMTSSEPERVETDDEGIEKDSGESGDENESECGFSMRQVVEACEGHLASEGVSKGVEEHYRAVVRALVAESVDLTSFLQKISQGTEFASSHPELVSSEQELHMLHRTDWATFWQQVMQDLREGVKLKKIQYTKTPLEYALTPYEMLMEDIRSRRYTLNKVMINGGIPPTLKKDAHTIILDFIRSRPPLRNASERKLAPPKKTSCPIELLMESIKKSHISDLRHVTPPRDEPILAVEVGGHEVIAKKESTISGRKLIVPPLFNLSAEDDDDLSDVPPLDGGSVLSGPLSTHTYASRAGSPICGSPCHSSASGNLPSSQFSRVALDLAKYGNSNTPARRHSISICQTPAGPGSAGSSSPNSSLPPSRGSPRSSTSSHNRYLFCSSQMQKDFISSAHFASGLDCLSLNLEEVVHIRNVLTKAELEALPLDLSIKEDATMGRICFLCMKTRFGFWQRGRECRLCKRVVCKKCAAKMRIPTEHFENIPVAMLTPHSLSPRDDDQQPNSFSRAFMNIFQDTPGSGHARKSSLSGSVGSAPSSPASSRKGSACGSPQPPAPCVTKDIKKGLLRRSATCTYLHRSLFIKEEIRQRTQQMEESLRGELMAVCLDCKSMVLRVLRSIKHRKEQQHSTADSRLNLRLDLTPVYDQEL